MKRGSVPGDLAFYPLYPFYTKQITLLTSYARMVSILHRRLRDKFYPEPLPPSGTFYGQTVLITGATTGLGLAAAQHFITLGATIIITSRSKAQGETARQRIAQITGASPVNIHVMELDMSQYASCIAFMEGLKACEYGKMGIDCAVLNAGVINPTFVESPEGWYALILFSKTCKE